MRLLFVRAICSVVSCFFKQNRNRRIRMCMHMDIWCWVMVTWSYITEFSIWKFNYSFSLSFPQLCSLDLLWETISTSLEHPQPFDIFCLAKHGVCQRPNQYGEDKKGYLQWFDKNNLAKCKIWKERGTGACTYNKYGKKKGRRCTANS